MLKSNKFWIILLAAALLVSAVAAIALRRTPAAAARIYMDGVQVKSVDLRGAVEPYTFRLDGSGGFNVIAVENGRIRVAESDCPDGLCVKQGWHSGGAVPIVCLPHRLVIELERGNEPPLDAIVG